MKYNRRPAYKTKPPKKKVAVKSVAKLQRAVRKLQSESSAEKLRLDEFSNPVPLGQLFGASTPIDGIVTFDVTPRPAQGDQTSQRQGATIKLHSSHYQMLIGQQDNTLVGIKLRISWFLVKGQAIATGAISDFVKNIYKPNPFIGGAVPLRDVNSQMNPDFFPNFKMLRTKTIYMPVDQISGQKLTKTISAGFKYNKGMGHKIRFNQNFAGDSGVFEGQILMVLQCDRGNAGSATWTGGGNAYDYPPLTGLTIQYNKTDFYYDN